MCRHVPPLVHQGQTALTLLTHHPHIIVLQKDPGARPSVAALLRHPFIAAAPSAPPPALLARIADIGARRSRALGGRGSEGGADYAVRQYLLEQHWGVGGAVCVCVLVVVVLVACAGGCVGGWALTPTCPPPCTALPVCFSDVHAASVGLWHAQRGGRPKSVTHQRGSCRPSWSCWLCCCCCCTQCCCCQRSAGAAW